MFDFLLPTYTSESAYNIDYKDFYIKGFNTIIFDIDNTLVNHDKDANESCDLLIYMLHKIGYKVFIISNNNKNRVKSFCDKCKIDGYSYDAHKPSIKSYLQLIDSYNLDKNKTICIGDQLFTDIWAANNLKSTSILVAPCGNEIKFYIKIKRFFENFIKQINKIKLESRKL